MRIGGLVITLLLVGVACGGSASYSTCDAATDLENVIDAIDETYATLQEAPWSLPEVESNFKAARQEALNRFSSDLAALADSVGPIRLEILRHSESDPVAMAVLADVADVTSIYFGNIADIAPSVAPLSTGPPSRATLAERLVVEMRDSERERLVNALADLDSQLVDVIFGECGLETPPGF